MNTKQFFTDNPIESLEYTGSQTVDASFEPSEAETVQLDSLWNDFFGTDEYVKFRATVAQPIVQPYFYDGELHLFRKPKDELKQAQAQIDNLPWTVDHPPEKRITNSDQIRGFWSDPQWNDGQEAWLHIPSNDTDGVRYAVNNDEVSVGFAGALEWVDGEEYDANQRKFAYDHIASVESGRCGPEEGCGLHQGSDHVVSDSDDGTTPKRCGLHTDSNDDVEDHGVVTELTDGLRTTITEEGSVAPDSNSWSSGDWVAFTKDGERRHGKLADVDQERALVKEYNEEDDSFAEKTTMLATSSLREWDGPYVDSCEGICHCGCHDPPYTDGVAPNNNQTNTDEDETDSTNETMTDSLHEFIDENDLNTDDVIDRLNIDVPESATDFYDSEPSVDELTEDFDAVSALADSKQSLEEEITELNDELKGYKTEQFRDKAQRLAELTNREVDSLVEQFEDGELTIEAIDDKISVAEDAIGSAGTMPSGGSSDDGSTEMVADNDGTINDSKIDRTQGGRYNLSKRTNPAN